MRLLIVHLIADDFEQHEVHVSIVSLGPSTLKISTPKLGALSLPLSPKAEIDLPKQLRYKRPPDPRQYATNAVMVATRAAQKRLDLSVASREALFSA